MSIIVTLSGYKLNFDKLEKEFKKRVDLKLKYIKKLQDKGKDISGNFSFDIHFDSRIFGNLGSINFSTIVSEFIDNNYNFGYSTPLNFIPVTISRLYNPLEHIFNILYTIFYTIYSIFHKIYTIVHKDKNEDKMRGHNNKRMSLRRRINSHLRTMLNTLNIKEYIRSKLYTRVMTVYFDTECDLSFIVLNIDNDIVIKENGEGKECKILYNSKDPDTVSNLNMLKSLWDDNDTKLCIEVLDMIESKDSNLQPLVHTDDVVVVPFLDGAGFGKEFRVLVYFNRKHLDISQRQLIIET